MVINMSLFDGKNGRSDGTKDGESSSIPAGNRVVAVHGVFDSATVTLMRYSAASKTWFPTQAVWSNPDVFQGLVVSGEAKYKLQIDGSTSNTKIVAEV